MYKACSSCFIVSAPPRRFSYFVIRAYSLHFRAIRKFANLCFSGAFSTSKTWGSRKRMSKRSVVSVWYAQNSLPFCTEAWYTTLTSCEDPTKMLIWVCILLQMQPAPLTGTATRMRSPSRSSMSRMQPAPLTGTTTKYGVYHRLISFAMQPVPLTGTTTFAAPHSLSSWLSMMQPAPLTGTATFSMNFSPCVAVMQPTPLTGTTTLIQIPKCIHHL